MRIIEMFKRGESPRHRPSPRPIAIRIDTSRPRPVSAEKQSAHHLVHRPEWNELVPLATGNAEPSISSYRC
jgi:hypothetical protein